MTKELLQQALDALELQPRVLTIDNNAYPHTVARDEVIHKLKQALAQQAHFEEQPDGTVIPVDPSEKAQQEQPASVDAYVGAREDAAIWKKRALEAEELNRKFIFDVNGPTYLGEPVKQEQPAQKVSESWTDIVAVNLVREGVNKHKARELAAHFLTLFAPPTPPAQEPVAWMHETGSVWNGINRPDERGYWKPLYTHPAPTQPAQEPFKWYDGEPPFPQNQESFIAQTIYGDRVVLSVLPEEYTYDYTTADGTYMKAENIEKWMQFPDCEFLPPEPAPTQPALSDEQILDIFSKVSADGMGHYMTAVGRAIEAHCRGGNHG